MENKEARRPLALVTGASSGIGFELAKVFAKNGFDLIIAAEDREIVSAARTLKELGGMVEPLQVDLARAEGVDTLCGHLEIFGRPLDVAAINAGVGVSGEFAETDLERELNMIKLNVLYAVALTKFVVKDMVKRGQGRILITSSIAADAPGPYYTVYAATKAFLQSFAEGLRFELKDRGVTVTSLQPGPTDTNFFVRADMLDTKADEGPKDDPAIVAQDGFDALMAGKDHVVAGSFKNKVQSTMSKVIPEKVGAQMQAAQAKPGSAHH